MSHNKDKKDAFDILKRKSIRFKPGTNVVGWIDLDQHRTEFKQELVAIVCEESYRGCGLITHSTEELQIGGICRIQIGDMAPLKAEVRWRSDLDGAAMRVGFLFLE